MITLREELELRRILVCQILSMLWWSAARLDLDDPRLYMIVDLIHESHDEASEIALAWDVLLNQGL